MSSSKGNRVTRFTVSGWIAFCAFVAGILSLLNVLMQLPMTRFFTEYLVYQALDKSSVFDVLCVVCCSAIVGKAAGRRGIAVGPSLSVAVVLSAVVWTVATILAPQLCPIALLISNGIVIFLISLKPSLT